MAGFKALHSATSLLGTKRYINKFVGRLAKKDGVKIVQYTGKLHNFYPVVFCLVKYPTIKRKYSIKKKTY